MSGNLLQCRGYFEKAMLHAATWHEAWEFLFKQRWHSDLNIWQIFVHKNILVTLAEILWITPFALHQCNVPTFIMFVAIIIWSKRNLQFQTYKIRRTFQLLVHVNWETWSCFPLTYITFYGFLMEIFDHWTYFSSSDGALITLMTYDDHPICHKVSEGTKQASGQILSKVSRLLKDYKY